jgi:hypothetical protein
MILKSLSVIPAAWQGQSNSLSRYHYVRTQGATVQSVREQTPVYILRAFMDFEDTSRLQPAPLQDKKIWPGGRSIGCAGFCNVPRAGKI